MKKFTLLVLSLFAVFAFSSSAYCGAGPYVSFNAGVSMPADSDVNYSTGEIVEIESDAGFAGGVALGYDFGNNLRLEGEISYLSNEVDKATYLGINRATTGDVTSIAFLINGYYDFKNSTPFTPFISAGAGLANVEVDDFTFVGSGLPTVSDDDTVFAYQLSAGVGYAVTDQLSLDVKYRYFATADPGVNTAEYEYGSHGVLVGLRFGF
ncbi:MAG: porin family protein [Proteobacteria bacterium]|nr:porin family protein [Pseudomonadota bacterium]MBU1388407.1 porin family protein [Pseudomonadota bacterium]MBU1542769.1 porin family protein [Pseudomonadota bacterium]MBU2430994.1 porin family protein [Pseudomonadota bacterium]MBU2480152.1 porin family protein [Pseudomonadota bacterium]